MSKDHPETVSSDNRGRPGRATIASTIGPARSIATGAVAALIVGVALPAHAHHLGNHFKQRRHIERRAHGSTGTPYRYGGSSTSGFDCSGFTRWVYLSHGADLPHSSSAQFALGDRPGSHRVYKRKSLKAGDLVFHKTTSAQVGHVGIYVGRGSFISATSSQGVQVRSLYDPYYWGERWVGGVRLPATMMDPPRGRRDRRTRPHGNPRGLA